MIITVKDGNKPSYEIDLDKFGKEVVSFGRQSDCDIVLNRPFVSRLHGCFYKENNTWYVQDLDSTCGVFCHGEKINKKNFLSEETVTLFGSSHNRENSVEFKNVTPASVNYNQQPVNEYVPKTPVQTYQAPVHMAQPNQQHIYYGQPNLGMNWFNFLIYFGLYAFGVICIVSSIMYFNVFFETKKELEEYEMHYGYLDEEWQEFVDEYSHATGRLNYNETKSVCIIFFAMGLSSLLIGILPFYIRSKLAAFEAKGITEYLTLLFFIIGLYTLAIIFVIVRGGTDYFYFGALYITLSFSFYAANKVYFEKRRHLFH